MSYSFGIFPFRMAYRQNRHMRTQSQNISRANIADEYSAATENSETVGVALADPLRAAEIGPQKRTRTPLAMRPFAFALIPWIEGNDARCTARCELVRGRFKMKQQKQKRPLLHSSLCTFEFDPYYNI